MAVNYKLLRANYTVLISYPEAFVNPLEPTSTELNAQFAFGTAEDNMVFNGSCAILDDANSINQTSSDTDSTMTICDLAEVDTPTFQNYEVSIDVLRDLEIDAPGIFNMMRELSITAGVPLVVHTRIGEAQNAAFEPGQVVSAFSVETDYPTDIVEDNGVLVHGMRFKSVGESNINFRLVA